MAQNGKLTCLTPELRKAYDYCQALTQTHYENFPVASCLLPVHLRRSISAIYAFARIADDISDEGDLNNDARLELMTKYETSLYNIQYGKPPVDPLFSALKHTIECFNLPIQLFYDLLTAFRQDILKNRYQNFAEVADYCHYSANPIGRLLLHLAGQASAENLRYSDGICTGLQLINFIQDIEIDWQKGRCYIPLNELAEYNVDLNEIAQRKSTPQYSKLIQMQIQRAEEIYTGGMALGQNLPGFFGLEIRFIIASGYKVLQKLAKRKNLWQRPVLSKLDMIMLLGQTICKNPQPKVAIKSMWKSNEISSSILQE